jgi:PAS domain S-box-containing protein
LLDQRLLTFIGSLTSFGERPATIKKLAIALGAHDLLIFTKDPALNVLLPAPGLPQTLPQGRKWREFLSECLEKRQHSAELISPYDLNPVSVMGIAAADGSILALLGGSPDLALVLDVSILVPLLAAALSTERVASVAKGQIETESESAKQAHALMAALEATRRDLQRALAQAESDRAKLENSEVKLRTMMVTIPQLVWTCLSDGQCDYLSPQWIAYTGVSLNEQLGLNWLDRVIYPDDRERTLTHWMGAVEGKHDYDIEYRIRRHDGIYRWFKTRGTPVRAPDSGAIVYWFGTCTDIEDQKQAISNLEQERMLRERFVATLTHDLRTPLTAAKLSAQMILRNREVSDPVVKSAHRIIASIDRGDDMVRDLLDANLIRAGERLHLSLEECELNGIAQKTLEDLNAVHGERFELHSSESIYGFWNGPGLRRILENLCSNGIKYGNANSPVRVNLRKDDRIAEIAVSNQGQPIPEAEQSTLFDPFRRASNVGTQGGWGLGLTLVRGIAQAHGGDVEVESNRKMGTIFRVRVPLDSRNVASQ